MGMISRGTWEGPGLSPGDAHRPRGLTGNQSVGGLFETVFGEGTQGEEHVPDFMEFPLQVNG